MDNYHIQNALVEIWSIISRVNKYIDETSPWVLSKSEEDIDKEKLNSIMFNLANSIRKIAILIYPFMENTFSWDNLYSNNIKENTKVIDQGKPIFVRLDQEEEIEYIKGLMK